MQAFSHAVQFPRSHAAHLVEATHGDAFPRRVVNTLKLLGMVYQGPASYALDGAQVENWRGEMARRLDWE